MAQQDNISCPGVVLALILVHESDHVYFTNPAEEGPLPVCRCTSRPFSSAPLVCLCSMIPYIANNMDPDQTASMESGFIMFALIKITYLPDVHLNISNFDKHQYKCFHRALCTDFV